ncbi:TPA: hypothetical protein NJ626_000272 [Vibrio parahaemolyticus]|uniref:hypothetical protein n=1 Tax=Vibrio parahaemolyticus TaxID=670 RepID=UPI00301B912E|nr:hypothetical protein [Vibrio parahaemolyticus]HCM1516445.1 hypothetical protein [Vibrio parahaemolyticus]
MNWLRYLFASTVMAFIFFFMVNTLTVIWGVATYTTFAVVLYLAFKFVTRKRKVSK